MEGPSATKFKVGDVVTGKVVTSVWWGVWVRIGSASAFLDTNRPWYLFTEGMELSGLTVTQVQNEGRQVTVKAVRFALPACFVL